MAKRRKVRKKRRLRGRSLLIAGASIVGASFFGCAGDDEESPAGDGVVWDEPVGNLVAPERDPDPIEEPPPPPSTPTPEEETETEGEPVQEPSQDPPPEATPDESESGTPAQGNAQGELVNPFGGAATPRREAARRHARPRRPRQPMGAMEEEEEADPL